MNYMYEPIYSEFASQPFDPVGEFDDMQGMEEKEKEKELDLTEQIIFIRHIVIELTEDQRPLKTHFVLITSKSHIHLRYDHNQEQMISFEAGGVPESKMVHIFQVGSEISKLTLPSIDLQQHTINVQDSDGKMVKTVHFFFMDNTNQIQLV